VTPTTLHPLAAQYLERLERAAERLPRSRRSELVAEIEAHLAEATSAHSSDADVLSILDRLGEPDEIVHAEQPEAATQRDPRGTQEWAAIILLLLGGFVAGVGWLAGLIFLWGSRAWNTREKCIGTLVIPGGLATSLFIVSMVGIRGAETCVTTDHGPERCTGGPSNSEEILFGATSLILLIAPIATAIYLARRARKQATPD
jgi:uncharacterized membrane protein